MWVNYHDLGFSTNKDTSGEWGQWRWKHMEGVGAEEEGCGIPGHRRQEKKQ